MVKQVIDCLCSTKPIPTCILIINLTGIATFKIEISELLNKTTHQSEKVALKMAIIFMKLFVFAILFTNCLCKDDDGEIKFDGGDKFDESPQPDNPAVMDPEVMKEMQAEKEFNKFVEEAHKGSDPAENEDSKAKEILPKIESLYIPRNCQRKSQKGDLLVVHYTGWLAKSGRKFDTTVDVRRRYSPFEFVLGTGYVIRGWEKGLLDMCRGEKRKLVVPSVLGYGKKGLRGIIPREFSIQFFIR